MAQGNTWWGPTGFRATTTTMATKQYYVVKFASTAGQVKLASSSDDEIAGILQNEPAASESALIAGLGYCKAAAEASVTAGCALTASSTGRVKKTTTDKHKVVGYAQEASTTAGDIIKVLVIRGTHTDS
jgi:hypothetical protein